ncbi:MAG: hypothetical protein WAM14_18675, partial [Candidatus Nitrosopolaris sp.]
IEDCDILIGIFWKRFGTPTSDGKTGTEHEFHKAYEAWKKNKRPQIMLYFNQREYSPETSEETEQHTAVLKFKEKIQKEGEGLYRDYVGLDQFKETVYDHLSLYLHKFKDCNASPVQLTPTSDKLLFEEAGKKDQLLIKDRSSITI